ncbi:MAG: glycosyltransferase family 39 protein [Chloroflexi bacterium]|nr:MAG: glycosyltransferase family 39 protein [Chloroflexota bacterium]
MLDTNSTPTPLTTPPDEAEQPIAPPGKKRWFARHRFALGGILLISIVMNFYALGKNGFGSYYPAAIRSMLDSWQNFFFVSYDPGGFVSIDKPPVGFWLEAASAKIFGFNSVSILLPQALAGVLSVWLLYYLVRRHFGVVAGLLAALALALNPISILTNRNVTIDSTLTLVLLLGAWTVLKAAETGRLRWLLLTAFIVGIGFNIKMLEAYLVVPAYGLLYLLAAPHSLRKRIGHLALAGVLLLAVSLSWVVAVDLTPASQRPYVGSTQDNSELSLALGYNGIQRLLGSFGGFGGGSSANRAPNGTPPQFGNGGSTNTGGIGAGQQPPSGGSGGAGGLFDIGTPGPLRLFIQPLAGQIAWLLPFALLGAVALAWQRRPRLQSDRKQQSLLLWGMWLLTMGIFFSVASFFHQYYMTVMAPAIAALFGIGVVTMWQDYRRGGWRGWLLPIALVATVAEQVYILSQYPTWGQRLIPPLVVLGGIAVGALIIARIAPRLHLTAPGRRVLVPALTAGVLVLMLAPTVWAAIPILTSKEADMLVAGPTQTTSFGGNVGGGQSANASSDAALIRYLEDHQGTAKYLVAVLSSKGADAIILATNKPVMTLGGFSGSDPILTTSQLAALVESGQVKYFLLSGSGGFGAGGSGQSALITWIQQHSKVVPSSQWQSSATSSSSGRFGGAEQLYEYTGA